MNEPYHVAWHHILVFIFDPQTAVISTQFVVCVLVHLFWMMSLHLSLCICAEASSAEDTKAEDGTAGFWFFTVHGMQYMKGRPTNLKLLLTLFFQQDPEP